MDPLFEVSLDALVQQLKRNGLAAYRGPGCAYLGVGEASIVGKLLSHTVHSGQQTEGGEVHVVGLWLGVQPRATAGALFFDTSMGIQSTAEAAAAHAALNWLQGVLGPVLPLLGVDADSYEFFGAGSAVDLESFNLYAGPLQLTGDAREALFSGIERDHPLNALKDWLRRRLTGSELHWVRLYRVQDFDLGQDVTECYVDSEVSPEGAALLQAWPWPVQQGRSSFRQFFVVLPRAS